MSARAAYWVGDGGRVCSPNVSFRAVEDEQDYSKLLARCSTIQLIDCSSCAQLLQRFEVLRRPETHMNGFLQHPDRLRAIYPQGLSMNWALASKIFVVNQVRMYRQVL